MCDNLVVDFQKKEIMKKKKKQKQSTLAGKTCVEEMLQPLIHAKKEGWILGGEAITLEMLEYLVSIGAHCIPAAFESCSMKGPTDEHYGLILSTLINFKETKLKREI